MKKIIILQFLISFTLIVNAQNEKGEIVEWAIPVVYSAKSLHFINDDIKFDCSNCKVLEIKSLSGVSGYYVVGKGKIQIKSKNISDKVTSCIIRFNPADGDISIKIADKKIISDEGFVKTSMDVLIKSFKHCYHAGMNALIPPPHAYAINYFGARSGEILASFTPDEKIIYSFKEGKKL